MFSSFVGRDDYDAANNLVTAMEEADEGKLEQAKKDHCLKYIDTSVARLVKGIDIDPNAEPLDLAAEIGDTASAAVAEMKEDLT